MPFRFDVWVTMINEDVTTERDKCLETSKEGKEGERDFDITMFSV